MHPLEAMLSQLGFLARSLHMLLTQAIRLLDAGLDLGLDSQAQFQVQGCERVDQEITDGGIQRFAMYALANRPGMLNRGAHTHIRRHSWFHAWRHDSRTNRRPCSG